MVPGRTNTAISARPKVSCTVCPPLCADVIIEFAMCKRVRIQTTTPGKQTHAFIEDHVAVQCAPLCWVVVFQRYQPAPAATRGDGSVGRYAEEAFSSGGGRSFVCASPKSDGISTSPTMYVVSTAVHCADLALALALDLDGTETRVEAEAEAEAEAEDESRHSSGKANDAGWEMGLPVR